MLQHPLRLSSWDSFTDRGGHLVVSIEGAGPHDEKRGNTALHMHLYLNHRWGCSAHVAGATRGGFPVSSDAAGLGLEACGGGGGGRQRGACAKRSPSTRRGDPPHRAARSAASSGMGCAKCGMRAPPQLDFYIAVVGQRSCVSDLPGHLIHLYVGVQSQTAQPHTFPTGGIVSRYARHCTSMRVSV